MGVQRDGPRGGVWRGVQRGSKGHKGGLQVSMAACDRQSRRRGDTAHHGVHAASKPAKDKQGVAWGQQEKPKGCVLAYLTRQSLFWKLLSVATWK